LLISVVVAERLFRASLLSLAAFADVLTAVTGMREYSISSLTSEETNDFFGKGARLLDRVKKLGWRTNELRSQLPVQADEE
jgi:hypothetical protein